MILDAYYDSVRRLLGDGDPNKQITHVGLGTNAADPDPSDSALSGDAVLTPVLSVAYSDTDERLLTISFELGLDAGNGLVIQEVGLICADGTLVARKTREPLIKTPDMRIGESWDLQV